MAVTFTPYLRYKIINACLTNTRKPYPTLEEIQTALANQDIVASKRAIEKDFEMMRYDKRLGYFAPIEFSRKHHGYYYTDATYTIEKLPLTADELDAFNIILESLQRFKGAEVFSQVEGMFDKLDKIVLQQKKSKRSDPAKPVVDFERMPNSRGIEHFDKLYQAIIKQQPLEITYWKFDKGEPSLHVFHPYLLKEYKFRWYVLGYSEKRKSKVVLALDRIEFITTKKTDFKADKGIDAQKYFEHTIGITHTNTSVKEIKLWSSPSQGNYFKTQQLHPTQKIIQDDKHGLVLTLQLIPNYELVQTLLAFGPEVKVLEPATLQQEVKEMLAKSLKLYQK